MCPDPNYSTTRKLLLIDSKVGKKSNSGCGFDREGAHTGNQPGQCPQDRAFPRTQGFQFSEQSPRQTKARRLPAYLGSF